MMVQQIFSATIFVALISIVIGTKCTSPQVTSKSFTTEDATIVTNIAYISEFTVKCSSGTAANLYAELNGNVVPVSNVGADTFQVSWIEDIKTAKSGDREIRLFDEEGYTALRKAIRSEEDLSTVPALFTVTLNHPGAYNGPWLKSELVAAVISVVVAYFAFASRSKVLS